MRLHAFPGAPPGLSEGLPAGVELTTGDEPPDTPDAILIWGYGEHLVGPVLSQRPGVRWVHLRRAGISDLVLGAMRANPGVLFTNGRGGRGPAVAEYAVTALLALLKGLPELLGRHEWIHDFHMQEAAGRTVVVLGLGDVGLNAARLLRGLGMRVLGVRRRPGSVPEVDETFEATRLHEALPRATALIVAAPFTAATERMIGAAELALMPRGSLLVNVGRGELVDTAALVAALTSGRLAGAALDVFDEEPLPASSPLWRLPNVIISPHAASHTPESDDRGVEVFLDNLHRFQAGHPLLNAVDPELGY